jgi:hypothetical protein
MAKASKPTAKSPSKLRAFLNKNKINKPQSTSYSAKRDAKQPAKPLGWRFTDKGAKLLGVKKDAKPTKAQIEKYKNKTTKSGDRYMYEERRIDKGDVNKKEMFAKGGAMVGKFNINDITKHYAFAALWSSDDMDTGEPLDSTHDVSDISKKTMDKMRSDVKKFVTDNKDALEKSGLPGEQIGHDFWLTRNGHGAGFFDRSLDSDIEKQLMDSSREFGEVTLEVGDDGKIHQLGIYAEGGSIDKEHRAFMVFESKDFDQQIKIVDQYKAFKKIDTPSAEIRNKLEKGYDADFANWYAMRFEDGGIPNGIPIGSTRAGYIEDRKDPNGFYAKGGATQTSLFEKGGSASEEVEEDRNDYDDPILVREIEWHGEKNERLYNQQMIPILKNLKKKLDKGTFDMKLSAKLLKYYVDAADKSYNKEMNNSEKGYLLSVKDRMLLAGSLVKGIKIEYDANKLEGFGDGGEMPTQNDMYAEGGLISKPSYKSGSEVIKEKVIAGITADGIVVELEINNKPSHGDHFSMSQTTMRVVSLTAAKQYAKQYWIDFFIDDPSQLEDMNDRMGTKFRSPKAAAKYVLDTDGELHGLDFNTEYGEVTYKGRVFLFEYEGFGQSQDVLDQLAHIYISKESLAELRKLWNEHHLKTISEDVRIPVFNQDREVVLQDIIKHSLKKAFALGGQMGVVEGDEDTLEMQDKLYKHGGSVETITNRDAGSYAENKIPFKGANIEGKVLDNGDYVVLSFGHYPIWYFNNEDEKWYGNSDKFSASTGKHLSQSRPDFNATMLSHAELTKVMMDHGAKYELGGIMIKDLTQPIDNVGIAHSGDTSMTAN